MYGSHIYEMICLFFVENIIAIEQQNSDYATDCCLRFKNFINGTNFITAIFRIVTQFHIDELLENRSQYIETMFIWQIDNLVDWTDLFACEMCDERYNIRFEMNALDWNLVFCWCTFNVYISNDIGSGATTTACHRFCIVHVCECCLLCMRVSRSPTAHLHRGEFGW